MSETVSAGKKEFFLALLGAVILYLAGEYIKYILPSYKAAGDVLEVIMFAVFAYFVMTRYAAVYTYSLNNGTLRVNRKIGHRNKELEINACNMRAVKTSVKGKIRVYTMKKTIFHHKEDVYLIFKKDDREYALCFAPSGKLRAKTESLAKKGK
ncbi:MAG: hypothetical protein PUF72_04535 [Clostridiales bacterium]|nr:hypothetical protein [Clostridiales bacterium]